jgi:hypothetical protein
MNQLITGTVVIWYLFLVLCLMLFVTAGEWNSILVFLTGFMAAAGGTCVAVIWASMVLAKRADQNDPFLRD